MRDTDRDGIKVACAKVMFGTGFDVEDDATARHHVLVLGDDVMHVREIRHCGAVIGDTNLKLGAVHVREQLGLGRMNIGLVEAALRASGRRLVVLDDTEVTDDLVRNMTEVLTSFCARLYGRRSARNRADAAVSGACSTPGM